MQKSLLRRSTNRILHLIARFAPGCTTFRPFLHRLRGVKIYGNVFIGDDVYIENEYPECVEIHDEVVIGLRSTILAHARGPGRTIIEQKVWMGPCTLITASPGETRRIGEAAALASGSVVNKNVPAYTFVGGIPAKPIAKVTVPNTLGTSIDDFKKGLVPIKAKEKVEDTR